MVNRSEAIAWSKSSFGQNEFVKFANNKVPKQKK